MHGADCPSCGTHIELDVKPITGFVWCPKCQKLFTPAGTKPLLKPVQGEVSKERDSENGDKNLARLVAFSDYFEEEGA